jgi:hypothetical protein
MDYISIDDLGGLGFDLSDPADAANIGLICKNATAICDGHAMQKIGKTLVSEKKDVLINRRNNTIKVFTSFKPIISVESLKIYFSLKNFVEIPIADIIIHSDVGYIEAELSSVNVPSHNAMYSYFADISYYYGYEVIPADVVQAAVMIAEPMLSAYFIAKRTQAAGVTAIKDGERSISIEIPKTISAMAKTILDNYKRVR